MKPRRNVIGAQIRKLRCKAGWSQDQLTAKLQIAGLNISRCALAKIESGSQMIAEYQVYYFLNVFKVDHSDLAPTGFNPHSRDFHTQLSSHLCTEERRLRNLPE